MDEVTQQNSALVEQATAASAGLHDEAEPLARVVGVFTLANIAVASETPRRRMAPGPARQTLQAARVQALRKIANSKISGDNWECC